MKPANTKSMFSVLCSYMEKLDSGEVTAQQAIAMTKLIGQAHNLLNYELRRAIVMSNADIKANHRNLEIKNFDSIPENIEDGGKILIAD
jgi:hypothetical protein